MSLSENIRKYRKAKKMTQKELAALVGRTESAIQKYEAKENKNASPPLPVTPPLDILEKISKVLDVEMSILLDIQEPSNDEILKDVEVIIEKFNKDGYDSVKLLDRKKILNYFRNVLYNIDVVGPNPYNPKDEDLHRVLASEEFQSYTKLLIERESNPKEGE